VACRSPWIIRSGCSRPSSSTVAMAAFTAEVARPAPARGKGPVVVLGVERPDVEVLDAGVFVHVVLGGSLTQCAGQQAASVPAGAGRVARKQHGFGVSRSVCKAQQVCSVDSDEGPISLTHTAILPSGLGSSFRTWNDVRSRARHGKTTVAGHSCPAPEPAFTELSARPRLTPRSPGAPSSKRVCPRSADVDRGSRTGIPLCRPGPSAAGTALARPG
jgi:hypothetical protein